MSAPALVPPVLEAALAYVARGIPVFPCGQDKRPLTPRGFKDASADPEQVRRWWSQHRGALIGVPTGAASGLSVVDLDVDRETGETVGERALRAAGLTEALAGGVRARTPSGGEHIYFQHCEGVTSSAGRLAEKVDTRGEGGYVIAPGSVNGVGAYQWVGPSVLDSDPPAFPEALVAALRRDKAPPDNVVRPKFPKIALGPPEEDDDTADRLHRALARAPNTLGRDDWVRLALAVKHALGDAGRAAFLAFSGRYAESDRAKDAATWDGARPDGSAGAATAFHLLRDDGREAAPQPWGTAAPTAPAPTVPALFRSASSLKGVPVQPREWLVPDLIPSSTVTMLSGDGGTGKSLLALQLATAAAAGRPWLRREVKPGPALFLSAEDDDAELHRRLASIVDREGLDFAHLGNLMLQSLAGEDALLAMLHRGTGALVETPLFHALEAAVQQHRPAVVVLDTLADLHSGDENNRAQARQFIGMLRGIAIRHSCAVLLLAHPSLTGISSGSGSSGSTAWNGSVRSRLYLERVTEDGYEANPDARRLTTKKANYGPTGGEIALTWTEGVFVADPGESGLDRMAAGAKAERVFLKLLEQFESEGRHVNHTNGAGYAPTAFAGHPAAEGVTKRAFKAAMEALLGRSAVKIEEHGPPSRRRTRLVRAA